jgi:ComF family protein
VVPIPLHKRKLRERDFNQAELLGKGVAKYFSIPLENNVLKRKKFTLAQAKIKDFKKREENIKDIFEISPEFIKKCAGQNQNLLKDKIIILVDDVSTTGATLSEAAKVLMRAGAKEVWGVVVARG